ncbi:hypothetical protein CAPTEDRAFT_220869 [Capitella teleta]|uniref:Peptidase S1 domain-containing protein n=1 Tax=Capitella teleta TaxID=283909 RepID=R7VD84_CAPTE|nr:hypothetical protein CAPTEDRAFT_220869 [Capitella teleta]|eukprot:ELU14251.1 hypothetical protein CAPTEDRAFT_220869 [Capitella teleta]
MVEEKHGRSFPRHATDSSIGASFAHDPYVIGGVPASPGEFPHQLALHTTINPSNLRCGAILISATEALTASHCVDGSSPTSLYITAGLYLRDDPVNGQTRQLTSFTMHSDYCSTCDGFPNDIAVLTWEDPIDFEQPDVGVARLPDNDDNDFAGDTCVISGWGRTSDSSILPNAMYKADINVIFNDECASRVSGVSGATIFRHHICLYNSAEDTGSCNGDSGGPLNCHLEDPEDDRTHFVAGITSWGISSSGDCLQDYPSVYVRVSSFLEWIEENTSGVFYAKGQQF